MNPDEAQLLRQVQRGDVAAFDQVVRLYLSRAYAVAFRVLQNREDAEDLTQEAFIAALTNIASFDTTRPFGPWLFRIVANRALNARKARTVRRAEPLPLDYEAEGVSPLEAAERNEIGHRLAEAMKGLPERRQLIVRLYELEGFTSDEIGAMLDVPAGTVRWHLHEARAALRVALSPLKEGRT